MPEFLHMYDPHHTLLLVEEDFWTDKEVEEFWSGWIEYANRLKLKCNECGTHKWESVEFAIDEENKPKIQSSSDPKKPYKAPLQPQLHKEL